ARRPMDAVWRRQEEQAAAVVVDGLLEALPRIRFVIVQPDGPRVAIALEDDVRAGNDVKRRTPPGDAVVRRGVAGLAGEPAHVPHREEPRAMIVEHAVAEGHRGRIDPRAGPLRDRIGTFLRRRRTEHWVDVEVRGRVEPPHERRLLDEEVVDEQLAAEIDRDDGWRTVEIRRAHGIIVERATAAETIALARLSQWFGPSEAVRPVDAGGPLFAASGGMEVERAAVRAAAKAYWRRTVATGAPWLLDDFADYSADRIVPDL